MDMLPRSLARVLLLAATFALAAGISGCSAVSLPQPVDGATPTLDKDAINGIWNCSNSDYPVLATRLTDAAQGTVELGLLDQSDSKISLDLYNVVVRSTPAGWVASVEGEGSTDSSWVFGRVVFSGNTLTIYTPDLAKFRALVKSGQLSGTIPKSSDGKDTDDVTVNRLGPREFQNLQQQDVVLSSLFEQEPASTCTRH
jgi:hypothetical protein